MTASYWGLFTKLISLVRLILAKRMDFSMESETLIPVPSEVKYLFKIVGGKLDDLSFGKYPLFAWDMISVSMSLAKISNEPG